MDSDHYKYRIKELEKKLEHEKRKYTELIQYHKEIYGHLKNLSDASFEGIIIHDKGKILQANKAFARIFGYKVSEILGTIGIDYLVTTESKKIAFETLRIRHTKPYEMIGIKKNGKTFPIEVEAKEIIYNKKKLRAAAIRDISDRKINKQEIEEKYEALDYCLEGILILDENEKCIYANDMYLKMHGYVRSKKILGRIWTSFYSEPEKKFLQEKCMPLVYKKGIWQGKIEGKKKTGEYIHQFLRIKKLETGGFACFISDISQEIESEKELQSFLKSQDLMLREIHHRMKNNLQVVSSLLSLQAFQSKDPKVRHMFEESQYRIKAMSFIHEALYKKDDFTTLHLSDYLKKVAENVIYSYFQGKNISLSFEAESIQTDVDTGIACGLIVNEIISNACKYAFYPFHDPEEGVLNDNRMNKVVVRANLLSKNQFSILIEDNGIGLPPDFNMNTISSFGLQMVHMLMEQLKGTLTYETGEKGTKFICTFPLKKR